MFDQHASDEFRLPAELAGLERQLSELRPAAPRVDRDRLMFAAGQASATRPKWLVEPSWLGARFWPTAAATLAAASIALAAVVAWQSTELAAIKQHDDASSVAMAKVDEPLADDVPTEIGPLADRWPWLDQTPPGYLGLRYVALTRGVGALERPLPPTANGDLDEAPPATSRTLLKELLPQAAPASS